jgi:hypothetical protein
VCRRCYRQVADQIQTCFLKAVQRDGWPPEGIIRQSQIFDRYVAPVLQDGGKVVYFLADALRYEMGRDLGMTLADTGTVRVEACASSLPTVTPFGMAALMPGADSTYKIVTKGHDLVPAVGDQPLPGSKERMAFLKSRFGDRFADMTLEQVMSLNPKKPPKGIANAELLVVRTQELDSYGESMNLYQARKHMSGILGEFVTATNRLSGLGFTTFICAADHGHVFLPEVGRRHGLPAAWGVDVRQAALIVGAQHRFGQRCGGAQDRTPGHACTGSGDGCGHWFSCVQVRCRVFSRRDVVARMRAAGRGGQCCTSTRYQHDGYGSVAALPCGAVHQPCHRPESIL